MTNRTYSPAGALQRFERTGGRWFFLFCSVSRTAPQPCPPATGAFVGIGPMSHPDPLCRTRRSAEGGCAPVPNSVGSV